MPRFKVPGIRKGVSVAVSSVTYDTSIGNGVDSNGFADLPLKSGNKYVFVGSGGNDANTGLSHAQRKLTIAGGLAIMSGADQLLLAEGTTFTAFPSGTSFGTVPGFSPLYPTCIRSYDPADPTNTALYGRATRANRPKITSDLQQPLFTGAGPFHYYAFQGLCIGPTSETAERGFGVNNVGNGWLIEHCEFPWTSVGLRTGPDSATGVNNWITRANLIYAGYSLLAANTGGGVYADGCLTWTHEDNFVYHAGWPLSGTRSNDWSLGGTTQFRHSTYQQIPTDATIRRNLCIDASADGGTCRGNVTYTENLMIDCPVGFGLGEGNNYDTERPSGVTAEASYNAVWGTATIADSGANGWGMATGNCTSSSSTHHNLFARSQTHGAPGLITRATLNKPSYMNYHDNVIYDWGGDGFSTREEGAFAGTQVHTTYNNNVWENAASGTNVKYDTVTFANAYTYAQFFTAVAGYADKSAYVTAMMDNHASFPWRAHRATLMAGYNISA